MTWDELVALSHEALALAALEDGLRRAQIDMVAGQYTIPLPPLDAGETSAEPPTPKAEDQ